MLSLGESLRIVEAYSTGQRPRIPDGGSHGRNENHSRAQRSAAADGELFFWLRDEEQRIAGGAGMDGGAPMINHIRDFPVVQLFLIVASLFHC